VFGSSLASLTSPTSDVDLCIILPKLGKRMAHYKQILDNAKVFIYSFFSGYRINQKIAKKKAGRDAHVEMSFPFFLSSFKVLYSN